MGDQALEVCGRKVMEVVKEGVAENMKVTEGEEARLFLQCLGNSVSAVVPVLSQSACLSACSEYMEKGEKTFTRVKDLSSLALYRLETALDQEVKIWNELI